jgi:hypothetical protein
MIQIHELNTPNLTPVAKAALVTAINTVEQGLAEVTVSLTYSKQTDTRPRIAGEDYVAMPGVTQEAQTGRLTVARYTDNRQNRKLGRVGKVWLQVKSTTRSDGVEGFGYTRMRPSGITGFVVLGVKPLAPSGA